MVTIPASATVYDAVTAMNAKGVGSILVVDEQEEIVGIWTERDLMHQVLEEGFDVRNSPISNRMSRTLISVNGDDQAYQLYDKFLGRRIRHLLVEEDGRYTGILSTGDVMKANLREKSEDYTALNEMVSLEYYENWKEAQALR